MNRFSVKNGHIAMETSPLKSEKHDSISMVLAVKTIVPTICSAWLLYRPCGIFIRVGMAAPPQAWASNCAQESRAPDTERQEEARRWNFLWDGAGQCWRCWRCLVTVQQFKNLKRHHNGVKCRQRSGTLACQSSRQLLTMGGFQVRCHSVLLPEQNILRSVLHTPFTPNRPILSRVRCLVELYIIF